MKNTKWTDEIVNFVKSEMPLRQVGSLPILLKFINVVFDTDFSLFAMKTMMTEKRIRAEIIIKRKRRNFNQRPVGYEHVKKGMINIKYAEPNVWRQKQVVVYERATGDRVKKGEVVIFLDSNNRNFAPENLYKLSRGELQQLNSLHGISTDPKETMIAIGTVKLRMAKIKVAKKYGLANKQGNMLSDAREWQKLYRLRKKMKSED
jgi:hypothetical protein